MPLSFLPPVIQIFLEKRRSSVNFKKPASFQPQIFSTPIQTSFPIVNPRSDDLMRHVSFLTGSRYLQINNGVLIVVFAFQFLYSWGHQVHHWYDLTMPMMIRRSCRNRCLTPVSLTTKPKSKDKISYVSFSVLVMPPTPNSPRHLRREAEGRWSRASEVSTRANRNRPRVYGGPAGFLPFDAGINIPPSNSSMQPLRQERLWNLKNQAEHVRNTCEVVRGWRWDICTWTAVVTGERWRSDCWGDGRVVTGTVACDVYVDYGVFTKKCSSCMRGPRLNKFNPLIRFV